METKKPLLTDTFLKFFLNLNLKNKTYLEIGSGNSTVFFSKHFKQIISFEDSMVWYDKLDVLKIPNVNLQFFTMDLVFDDCTECTGVKNKLKHYLQTANFIMIDNNPIRTSRTKFAKFVDQHKKPESIIILDNGEQHLEAMTFLKSKYYCIDFPGKRYDDSFSVTSMFFTNDNYKELL